MYKKSFFQSFSCFVQFIKLLLETKADSCKTRVCLLDF